MVSFKSSKSIPLSAFTMETNRAAGKAYVNTNLFSTFESVVLKTFRFPAMYPKNMMTKMGRMSLINISIITNYFFILVIQSEAKDLGNIHFMYTRFFVSSFL